MKSVAKPLQPFNLDTMSGIHPGTRTAVYRRLLLESASNGDTAWYTLSWHTTPPAQALSAEAGPLLAAWPAATTASDLQQMLDAALAQSDLTAHACSACRNWRGHDAQDADGAPIGRCTLNPREEPASPALSLLGLQSAYSLACDHFVAAGAGVEPPPQQADASPPPTDLRLVKAAELSPDRQPPRARLLNQVRGWFARRSSAQPSWEERLVERSGVGAGTEPCFVCQGRMANLGAITVADEHNDKQTISIWRCRVCLTLYLNDWIDRWERLDNLETEERYYRVAPIEAYTVLRIIHATEGADHPAKRSERAHLRRQIQDLLDGKAPLSHQIRQGR